MPHLLTRNLPVPTPHNWTVNEFERLFELGLFAPDKKFELLEGEIFQKMSQNAPHIRAILMAQYKFLQVFGSNYLVCVQVPLILGENSKPEPDIAIVQGTLDDPEVVPATTAELVIEISDSTLVQDQTTKAAIYARAQIAEYWIVNLVERTLEVRRQPAPMPNELLGHGYRSTQILLPGESIAPLGAPNSTIGVDELLP